MENFAKKISSHLTSADYRLMCTKEGVENILKGYGYPLKVGELNDSNWEEISNILIDGCL